MDLGNQFLFFFSAIGVFNGLFLCTYLLIFTKKKHPANTLLAILILMLCIRIGKSVFFYFVRDLSEIYRQIGLSACFLIGPSLYFYLKLAIENNFTVIRRVRQHLLLMSGLVLCFGIIIPYAQFPDTWNHTVVRVIYLQWSIYLVAAGFVLKEIFSKWQDKSKKLVPIEKWLLIVFISNVWICFSYNSALYNSHFPYILGPVSFSFIFYFFVLFLLLNKNRKLILFQQGRKYSNKKIEEETAESLLDKLDAKMKEHQLYKQPKLKLEDVAGVIGISAHQLSQLLNDNLGKRFSLFVNEYRVEEAIQLFQSTTNLSLEGIGFEVGFSSKSTFYSTFRKIKGTTPAKYREELLKKTPIL